jgi:hypothetical protein
MLFLLDVCCVFVSMLLRFLKLSVLRVRRDDLNLIREPDTTKLCDNGSVKVSKVENTFANGLTKITGQELSDGRYRGIGTAVLGTKVFFAGGYEHGGVLSDKVDIFELRSGTPVRTSATLSEGRYGIAGASIKHIAMFFGGMGQSTSNPQQLNKVDVYNNNTNSWSSTTMSAARGYGAAAGVGSLILFGGGREQYGVKNNVDIYNVDTDTWSTASLSEARFGLAAVTVGTKVLFAGGGTSYMCGKNNCNKNNVMSDTVDIYESSDDTWSTGSLTVARSFLAGVAHGTKAFFGGGDTSGSDTGSKRVDIYDSATGSWSSTDFSAERTMLAAAASGKAVIFFGGASRTGESISSVFDIYNVEEETWVTDNSASARMLAGGASVGDYAVFAGGFDSSGSDTSYVDILKYETQVTVYAVVNASSTEGSFHGRVVFPLQIRPLGVNISLSSPSNVMTDHALTDTWNIECRSTVRGKLNETFSLGAADPVCIALNGQCPLAKYSSGDGAVYDITTCLKCPTHRTTAAVGSTRITDCKCNAGFSGPDGDSGTCVACVAGKYKSVIGSSACLDCPVGKHSDTIEATDISTCESCPADSTTTSSGSTQQSQCLCNIGYKGPDGGTCESCAAGKYKSALGSAECTQCEAGKHSASSGATSIGACTNCAVNTYSSADNSQCTACPSHSGSVESSSSVTDCKCNAGFTGPDGVTCNACSSGTYKDVTGDATCSLCPGNSNSPDASNAQSACICNQGYTGPAGGTCVACSEGTYKAVAGTEACSVCTSNSISAAASVSANNCVCNMGFTGPDGGACLSCAAGKYKAVTGSNACTQCEAGKHIASSGATTIDSCTNCGVNTYSSADNSACEACPSNSVSVEASSVVIDCICDIGFTGPNGGSCIACAAGKFKAVTGTNTCTTCSAGTYAGSGQTVCTNCPDRTDSLAGSNEVADCKCNFGFTAPQGEACQPCPAGTYKDVLGSASCSNCPLNTISALASSALAHCICKAGYTGSDGTDCSACLQGDYKDVNGSAACQHCVAGEISANPAQTVCETCTAGSYSSSSRTTCISCPDDSTSSTKSASEEDCRCNVGFTGGNGETCTGCNAGTYKDSAGSASCTLCPAGKYSETTRNKDESLCLACADLTTSTAGTAQAQDCTCNAGHTGPNGGPCQACVAGKYKESPGSAACTSCESGKYSATGAATSVSMCLSCPQGSTSPLSSDGISDCRCDVGYTMLVDTCTACPAGKFNAELGAFGEDKCISCAAGKYSDTSAATSESTCLDCAKGTYSQIAGAASATSCTACPGYSDTVGTASTIQADCKCNLGYTGPDGAECTACDKGTYKTSIGSSACVACAIANYAASSGSSNCTQCIEGASTLQTGSDKISDCLCTPGRTGNPGNGVSCDQCEGGKYKAQLGTGACTSCPSESFSSQGSSSLTDCVCNPGHTNVSETGVNCTKCIAGTYKPLQGPQSCSLCGQGKYSVGVGQINETTCANCPRGTLSLALGARSNTTCQPCQAGKFMPGVGATACQNCPDNAVSDAGAFSVNECRCLPGYTGPNGLPCNPCPAGYYKTDYGSGGCLKCPPNGQSPTASASAFSCACNPGYTGMDYINGVTCVLCKSNRYKNSTGNFPCTDCPMHSVSTPGAINILDCACDMGYTTGPNGECVACKAGKFKMTIGRDPCKFPVTDATPANSSIKAELKLTGITKEEFLSSVEDFKANIAESIISKEDSASLEWGADNVRVISVCIGTDCTMLDAPPSRRQSSGAEISVNYVVLVPIGLSPNNLAETMADPETIKTFESKMSVSTGKVIGARYDKPPQVIDSPLPAPPPVPFQETTLGNIVIASGSLVLFLIMSNVMLRLLVPKYFEKVHSLPTTHVRVLLRDISHQYSREKFQSGLAHDLSLAIGVDVKNILVTSEVQSMTHVSGAYGKACAVVRVHLLGFGTDNAMHLFDELIKQSKMPDSVLMRGTFAAHIIQIDAIRVGPLHSEWDLDEPVDDGHERTPVQKKVALVDWTVMHARLQRWTSRPKLAMFHPTDSSIAMQNFVMPPFSKFVEAESRSRPSTPSGRPKTSFVVSGFDLGKIAREKRVIFDESTGPREQHPMDEEKVAQLLWEAETLAGDISVGVSGTVPDAIASNSNSDAHLDKSGELDDPEPFIKLYPGELNMIKRIDLDTKASHQSTSRVLGYRFSDGSSTIFIEDFTHPGAVTNAQVKLNPLQWEGLENERRFRAMWQGEDLDNTNEAEFNELIHKMSNEPFLCEPGSQLLGGLDPILEESAIASNMSPIQDYGKLCEIQDVLKSLEDGNENESCCREERPTLEALFARLEREGSSYVSPGPITRDGDEFEGLSGRDNDDKGRQYESPRVVTFSEHDMDCLSSPIIFPSRKQRAFNQTNHGTDSTDLPKTGENDDHVQSLCDIANAHREDLAQVLAFPDLKPDRLTSPEIHPGRNRLLFNLKNHDPHSSDLPRTVENSVLCLQLVASDTGARTAPNLREEIPAYFDAETVSPQLHSLQAQYPSETGSPVRVSFCQARASEIRGNDNFAAVHDAVETNRSCESEAREVEFLSTHVDQAGRKADRPGSILRPTSPRDNSCAEGPAGVQKSLVVRMKPADSVAEFGATSFARGPVSAPHILPWIPSFRPRSRPTSSGQSQRSPLAKRIVRSRPSTVEARKEGTPDFRPRTQGLEAREVRFQGSRQRTQGSNPCTPRTPLSGAAAAVLDMGWGCTSRQDM